MGERRASEKQFASPQHLSSPLRALSPSYLPTPSFVLSFVPHRYPKVTPRPSRVKGITTTKHHSFTCPTLLHLNPRSRAFRLRPSPDRLASPILRSLLRFQLLASLLLSLQARSLRSLVIPLPLLSTQRKPWHTLTLHQSTAAAGVCSQSRSKLTTRACTLLSHQRHPSKRSR